MRWKRKNKPENKYKNLIKAVALILIFFIERTPKE